MYNITQKEFGKYFISYGGAEREIRFNNNYPYIILHGDGENGKIVYLPYMVRQELKKVMGEA